MFVMGVLVAALRAFTVTLAARLVIAAMMGSAVLAIINGMVRGWLALHLAGAPVGRRNSHSDQPFNIAQISPFLVVAK